MPPISFAQEAVRETVPSVIEPVICFALGPSPCQVPSIKAKLVFTGVCDVIVNVWSGAQLDAPRLFWLPFGCPPVPTMDDAGPSILTKRNCLG